MIMLAVMSGMLLAALNQTIVSTALPFSSWHFCVCSWVNAEWSFAKHDTADYFPSSSGRWGWVLNE
jgi:hypothetical protein